MLVGSKNKRSRGELFGYTAKDIFVNCFPDGYAETEAIEDEAGEDGVGFHRRIKSSNVLTAALANVQEKSRSLKLLAKTRWGSMALMLESHIKSADDIRAVATLHPDRVSVSI